MVVLGEHGGVEVTQLGPEHRAVVGGAVGSGGGDHVPAPLAHARHPGLQQPHLVPVAGVEGARPDGVPGDEQGRGDEQRHQGARRLRAVQEQDEQDARAGDRARERSEPAQGEHVRPPARGSFRGPVHRRASGAGAVPVSARVSARVSAPVSAPAPASRSREAISSRAAAAASRWVPSIGCEE